MKRVLSTLLLFFSVNAMAGVFDARLYKYATEEEVVMITYFDQVAHCATIALSVGEKYQKSFDGEDLVGTEFLSLQVLEMSSLDQIPLYKGISDRGNGSTEYLGQLRDFLQLPKQQLLFHVMDGTVKETVDKVNASVIAGRLDGSLDTHEDVAHKLYLEESCAFSIGYYLHMKGLHDVPHTSSESDTEE